MKGTVFVQTGSSADISLYSIYQHCRDDLQTLTLDKNEQKPLRKQNINLHIVKDYGYEVCRAIY